MAKGKARDKSKEAYWQQKLHEHSQSGLSIRAFCRQQKLAETAFYFWRREIARRRREQRAKPRRGRALFVPVRVTADAQSAPGGEMTIALADGRRIHLTPPVDKQALSDVLAVMEVRPC
jgi:hypothetical protein